MPARNQSVSSPRRSRPRWRRVPGVFINALGTLLNEFRWPVFAFFLVTIAGGFLYGELHIRAGREPIALIDRPYVMLQLMILETPAAYDDAPDEWYLISFWYILPLIFVFIVGNGVADFVRLFFGDAWRKVLISNQEGHVIVLGAGHVGLRVVRWLRQWGRSVVVIDNRDDPDKRAALRNLKAELIIGDARNPQILRDANIDEAAAFIACTGDDTVNLYAIMRARALNPAIRIVVRVWDDSFNDQIDEFIIHSQTGDRLVSGAQTSILSSSNLAAPVFAGLALKMELTQVLYIGEQGFAAVRLMVNEGSPLAGQSIDRIQQDNQADVVLYQSSKGHFQVRPSHDRRVQPGDTIVLFTEYRNCIEIAKRNYAATHSQGRVIVLGAGHVGLRVIRWLIDWDVPVTIIDNELEQDVLDELKFLQQYGASLEIVRADGREKSALLGSGILTASAFVAATGDDAVNLYAIMRARALNPDAQIVVRVWDDSFNEQIEQFIINSHRHQNGDITSVRSSANLAAPIFAGVALGIDLTQTLTVRDWREHPEKRFDVQYAAVRLDVMAGSVLEGQTIDSVQQQTFLGGKRVDVVAYCASGTGAPQVPPRRETPIHAGDVIVLFAELDVCMDVALQNQVTA